MTREAEFETLLPAEGVFMARVMVSISLSTEVLKVMGTVSFPPDRVTVAVFGLSVVLSGFVTFTEEASSYAAVLSEFTVISAVAMYSVL